MKLVIKKPSTVRSRTVLIAEPDDCTPVFFDLELLRASPSLAYNTTAFAQRRFLCTRVHPSSSAFSDVWLAILPCDFMIDGVIASAQGASGDFSSTYPKKTSIVAYCALLIPGRHSFANARKTLLFDTSDI